MKTEAWFDGACGPRNPGGHTSCAVVIKQDGKDVFVFNSYLGHGENMSNNVGEYSGIILVLTWLISHPNVDYCTIYGDSKLVIYQLLGKWQAHEGMYKPYYEIAKKLYEPIKHKIKLKLIPRHLNEQCDALSKSVMRPK